MLTHDDTPMGARRLRRLAGLAVVPVVIAAAVGGAIAASPGPEAELAAGKGKVVKYEGTWAFAQSPDETQAIRASGVRLGQRAVRARGSFAAAGDRCPTAMSAEDRRAGARFKRPGKSTWRQKGDNTNATGDYTVAVRTGRKIQRLEAIGNGPACNRDGSYQAAGKFTGPKGGTALGKRFKGRLIGDEDPPNRIRVLLRAKRVG